MRSLLALLLGALCVLALLCSVQAQASSQTLQVRTRGEEQQQQRVAAVSVVRSRCSRFVSCRCPLLAALALQVPHELNEHEVSGARRVQQRQRCSGSDSRMVVTGSGC